MKRVVVTGVGALSPLGVGAERNWNELLAGRSGIRRSEILSGHGLCSEIAGVVPEGNERGELNLAECFSRKELSRNDRFILLAKVAAREAIEQAGWVPNDEKQQEDTGVIVGVGMGGFITMAEGAEKLSERGQHGISPFFVPAVLANLAGGQLAIDYGFKGPNYSVASACATGADAIMTAARTIQLGEARVVVAGGAEAGVHPLAAAGFCQSRALSTAYAYNPSAASRPFDKDRDGFVLAEGAGILVLEELEHANQRGAEILAELVGYASAGDAYHITATDPEGRGESRVMSRSLAMAGVSPGDVGYLNAHATSTPVGDRGELAAARAVFGTDGRGTAISATKSATGHMLGAAGALEAIYTIQALRDQVVPPTLNLDSPDDAATGLNLVRDDPQERSFDFALSNAFGFGSTKAALLFRKMQ